MLTQCVAMGENTENSSFSSFFFTCSSGWKATCLLSKRMKIMTFYAPIPRCYSCEQMWTLCHLIAKLKFSWFLSNVKVYHQIHITCRWQVLKNSKSQFCSTLSSNHKWVLSVLCPLLSAMRRLSSVWVLLHAAVSVYNRNSCWLQNQYTQGIPCHQRCSTVQFLQC